MSNMKSKRQSRCWNWKFEGINPRSSQPINSISNKHYWSSPGGNSMQASQRNRQIRMNCIYLPFKERFIMLWIIQFPGEKKEEEENTRKISIIEPLRLLALISGVYSRFWSFIFIIFCRSRAHVEIYNDSPRNPNTVSNSMASLRKIP